MHLFSSESTNGSCSLKTANTIPALFKNKENKTAKMLPDESHYYHFFLVSKKKSTAIIMEKIKSRKYLRITLFLSSYDVPSLLSFPREKAIGIMEKRAMIATMNENISSMELPWSYTLREVIESFWFPAYKTPDIIITSRRMPM